MMQSRSGANAPEDAGAQGVRRAEVGQSVSEASAARTRTMEGQTVEFRAVDYRPVEGARPAGDTRPRAVKPVGGAGLGQATGVSSLRKASAGRPGEPKRLSTKMIAAIAGILAVVAVLVFAGGYVLMRGALVSVSENASNASSGAFATDAYTLFAVEGPDGALQTAYLGYVDSINERVEFCRVPATVRYTEDGVSGLSNLADVYAARGLEGLMRVLGSSADVAVATGVHLDASQMEQVLDLASASSSDPAQLASAIWDDRQQITEPALRGMLTAMKQIGSENHVVLEAPVEDTEGAQVLRPQEWISLVQGMRDPTAQSYSLAA